MRCSTPRGHAIECRVYAEDPDNGFMPSPGRITGLRVPQGPGVRDDSGAYEGGEVPIYYDPMISKLITWGEIAPHALARMRRALAEYEVRGIKTTIPFFQWLLDDEDFVAGRFDTGFIDRKLSARNGARAARAERRRMQELAAIAAALVACALQGAGVAIGRAGAGREPVEGFGAARRAARVTPHEVSVRNRRSRPHGRSAAVAARLSRRSSTAAPASVDARPASAPTAGR